MGRAAIPRVNGRPNDMVMTPLSYAEKIVWHFMPEGTALDPCAGSGAFFKAMAHYEGLSEVERIECDPQCLYHTGTDFYQYKGHVDWIISNPPYSHLTQWLKKSFEVADNVVYLVQGTAPFFTSRLNAAQEAGFGILKVLRLDCPDEWRKRGLSFGTGLAAVHWKRGWLGPTMIVDGRVKNELPGDL